MTTVPDLYDLAARIERLTREHPAAPKVEWLTAQFLRDMRAIAAAIERSADAPRLAK
jgi:hypothetical protein